MEYFRKRAERKMPEGVRRAIATIESRSLGNETIGRDTYNSAKSATETVPRILGSTIRDKKGGLREVAVSSTRENETQILVYYPGSLLRRRRFHWMFHSGTAIVRTETDRGRATNGWKAKSMDIDSQKLNVKPQG